MKEFKILVNRQRPEVARIVGSNFFPKVDIKR